MSENVISDLSTTDKRFGVIYADPPWSYKTYSDKGLDRSAEKHYSCMDFESIKKLPVQGIAAKDCVLLMWVTDPFLKHGLELMEAWGFRYKTVGFNWAKLNKRADFVGEDSPIKVKDFFTGMGHWTRANAELCLLGSRGSPKRKAKDVRRLIVSPRREHSRKPDEVIDRIEKLVDGPYLEMFGRTQRPGWTVFGNEVEKF